MRPDRVEVTPPTLDDDLSLSQRVEDFAVYSAQRAFRVMTVLARRRGHAVRGRYQGELRAVGRQHLSDKMSRLNKRGSLAHRSLTEEQRSSKQAVRDICVGTIRPKMKTPLQF
jgi:uncharacterized protein (DUF934 family)